MARFWHKNMPKVEEEKAEYVKAIIKDLEWRRQSNICPNWARKEIHPIDYESCNVCNYLWPRAGTPIKKVVNPCPCHAGYSPKYLINCLKHILRINKCL